MDIYGLRIFAIGKDEGHVQAIMVNMSYCTHFLLKHLITPSKQILLGIVKPKIKKPPEFFGPLWDQ